MHTKHTPGPWKVNENGMIYWTGNTYDWGICNTQCSEMECLSYETTLANARLIAAAPRMLSALVGAQSALRKALPYLPADNEAVYAGEWLDEINATIKEATKG